MKLHLVDNGTKLQIVTFHQNISVPVPVKGDVVTHGDMRFLVKQREYNTADKSELTGLRYPEVKLFVENLK